MKKTLTAFIMVFICNIICAQDFMTEIVINGNISYLDNLLEVHQINDFTLNELRILRNTIFAKYGYKFTSDDLTIHFSQFLWYEGTKISVENELTLIDWKNIELIKILEDYYPTKIDYIFNFYHNGIYKLDNNFILTPIYTSTNNNPGANWWASYDNYIQLDDILFFYKYGGIELLYDYITNFCFNFFFDIDIEHIDSIYYETSNTLVINGSSFIYNTAPPRARTEPFSFTVNFPDNRFEDEIIGRIVNFNNNLTGLNEYVFNYSYFLYETICLFSIFDKNIIAVLDNYPKNSQYAEVVSLNVIYNDIYDVYFLLVNHDPYVKE
jgi:hypothetical protein